MARFSRVIGRNRDIPQFASYQGAAAAGGTAADFERPIVALTDLTLNAPSGSVGSIVSNAMSARACILTFMAAITGDNTNNCAFSFVQYRSGAILVNTTSATTITAGTRTVTPTSMTNLYNGQQLIFSGGTGATETVVIYNLTPTTFQATFANGHSGAYAITSAPLASTTFQTGVNASAIVPIQFASAINYIKGGDVITIKRVSNNVTGLATPAFDARIDWVPAGLG
jgi:hypothetical protein